MLTRYAAPAGVTVRPSGGDDTTRLTAIFALAKDVTLEDPNGLDFQVSGTIPVYARVRGIGDPLLIVTTSAVNDRGLWIKSGGGLEDMRIKRINTQAAPTSGAYCCAITTGQYSTTEECRDFVLRNLRLESSPNGAGASWNVVSIMGDSWNFQIENLVIDGDYLIPLMFHWGFDKEGTSEVVNTFHPRFGTVQNVFCLNRTDAVDVSNQLTTNSFGIYMSGCHDITVTNHLTRGGTAGMLIAVGDFGDERADAPSVGRVLSNIVVNGFTAENVPGEVLWVAGKAEKIDYFAERWVGTNKNMGVNINGVHVIRGNNSTSTNPGMVKISFCRNVNIRGLTIRDYDGVSMSDNDAVVEVVASVDCLIQGTTESGSGWLATSGKNITFECNAYCTNAAAGSNLDGIEVMGSITNATVKEAVSANDTTITLDATADIYPGMLFEYGGYRFEFTEGFAYDSVTAANNQGVVLSIYPAPIAIPDESTIELYTGVNGLIVKGRVEAFNVNCRMNSSDARMPRGVRWEVESRRSRVSDIIVEGGVGRAINSVFDYSSMNGTANQEQVDIQGGIFDVMFCEFNRDTRFPKSPICIYRQTAASSKGIITGNKFWGIDETQATKGAIRVGTEGDPIDLIANNYFDPSISTPLLATSIAGKTTIGGQEIISDTAARSTGTVADGTITYDSDPAAAGAGLSGITTEGTFGTLNSGSTTGSITNATNSLVVNSTTGLKEGDYITIAGVTGVKKVWRIVGTTVYLTSNADATVSGAAVAFSTPVSKTLATYAA